MGLVSSPLTFHVSRFAFSVIPSLLLVAWGCERGNEASAPAKPKPRKPAAAAKKPAPPSDAHADHGEKENALAARLANKPDDVDSRLKLANLYFDTERPALAIAAYQEVLKARPDDPDVRTDLGTCYRNLEKLDQAQAEYERVLQKHPNHLNATYNLAVVRHLAGDNPRAAELWARVAALAPGTPLAEAAANHASAARLGLPMDKTKP